MDAMTWTVLQLMTDTEILSQQAQDLIALEDYQLSQLSQVQARG
jgi:hypothetical protein